ncbi:restriction endonuclease [Enterococcus avium]|uniref:Restriction endonuclease n=1 Tax=Enterococcus avium TaxID=33945 RepID=A0ABD5F8A5_ENTAV|nr:restriction endonuclease [Enterococcus avium]MDT2398073.1 restriction endonuclease [Enterococcus avium]MDT2434189.1 restriction endonuclease [Enterococcus avium]MDT2447049.1 restriction endonuclease [Enterococcus avium]MDT2464989.1 restriction endonuclease [Enterococcus avium]MDT2482162.1 restriction endonuclease [Enterococcus avium]
MFNKFKNRGRKFEDVIEDICRKIAEDERINAKISKRIPIIGADNTMHEFDVLYEYEHFGLQYKVALECKSWNKTINKSQVTDFAYKLNSVGNINGIFLSETKLQKGAKMVSEYENIKYINYSDFRKFSLSHTEKYLIPNYRTIGDPFWMFLNTNGKNFYDQNIFINETLYLFESKYYAIQFQEAMFNPNNSFIKLIGVSQQHLKDIRSFYNTHKINVALFNTLESDLSNNIFRFIEADLDDIDSMIR